MTLIRTGTRSDLFSRISAESVREPALAAYLERVRLRLPWLKTADRVLLDLYINENAGLDQLAHASGLSRGQVRRRIANQCRRLLDDRYAAVIRKRDLLSPEMLAAAYDHLLLGLGYRRLAARPCWPRSRARRILSNLNQWLKTQPNHQKRSA